MRKLLSAPKIRKLLAVLLPKLHEPALSNAIPYSLYTYFLSVLLATLNAPNKQF